MSDHPKKENADTPASPVENTEKQAAEIQDKDLEKTAGGSDYWEYDISWNADSNWKP